MANGYEDIDKLVAQKNQGYEEALQKQNDIVNQQTQMQVDSLARQKEQIDRETTQQNRALYQDYRKASNPFGEQAENLAGQGLANSGYAETTQSRLYNTYQNNITSTLNNARQLKADVDFQIQQARQTGDITLAQNALELFNQKMQLLSEEYDLRQNREQYLYQKQQDALAQANWQKEFDYNKAVADRNYNYQVSRDKVSDSQWNKQFKYQQSRDKVSDKQWQKEYELSKKNLASSSRSYSRSTGGGGNNNKTIPVDTGDDQKNNNSKATNNLAETALKALGNSNLVKLLKTGAKGLARPIIMGGVLKYQQTKGKEGISEKQAEALFDKYGL